jgi:hypothetical protein
VGAVNLIFQDESSAAVNADATLTRADGTIRDPLGYFVLRYDPFAGAWRIADKRPPP